MLRTVINCPYHYKDCRGRNHVVVNVTYVIIMPVTAKVVISNPDRGEVYSMQLLVIPYLGNSSFPNHQDRQQRFNRNIVETNTHNIAVLQCNICCVFWL